MLSFISYGLGIGSIWGPLSDRAWQEGRGNRAARGKVLRWHSLVAALRSFSPKLSAPHATR